MVQLFVYGTLRSPVGGPEDDTRNYLRIERQVLSVQPAMLRNADLLSFIHYPGVWPGSGVVVGELFELTDEGLTICDQIEGHPDWYERRMDSVELADGRRTPAWVYWMPEEMVGSGELIASGDWFDRDRSRSDGRTFAQALAEDRAKR